MATGTCVGLALGALVGSADGRAEGSCVGEGVGLALGAGDKEGEAEGVGVGAKLNGGPAYGKNVGVKAPPDVPLPPIIVGVGTRVGMGDGTPGKVPQKQPLPQFSKKPHAGTTSGGRGQFA